MLHYSWNPETKRYIIYMDGQKAGTMWWIDGELYFACEEGKGSNSCFYQDIVKLMERIEYEQFGK